MDGEGRDEGEQGQLKLAPQNYFPGAGTVHVSNADTIRNQFVAARIQLAWKRSTVSTTSWREQWQN